MSDDPEDILELVRIGQLSKEAAIILLAKMSQAIARDAVRLMSERTTEERGHRRAGGAASGAARAEAADIAARFFVSSYQATLKERGGTSAAFQSAKRAMTNIGYERDDRTYRRWLKKLGH
jgi:hypothetical protein